MPTRNEVQPDPPEHLPCVVQFTAEEMDLLYAVRIMVGGTTRAQLTGHQSEAIALAYLFASYITGQHTGNELMDHVKVGAPLMNRDPYTRNQLIVTLLWAAFLVTVVLYAVKE